jgi:hypothetical protein
MHLIAISLCFRFRRGRFPSLGPVLRTLEFMLAPLSTRATPTGTGTATPAGSGETPAGSGATAGTATPAGSGETPADTGATPPFLVLDVLIVEADSPLAVRIKAAQLAGSLGTSSFGVASA